MQTFLRTVAHVVGSEVIEDVIAFFRAFEGMEEGFRARAMAVEELLADASTAFVLVTSPRRDAIDEAEFFAERLADHGQTVAALDREPCPSRVRRRDRPRASSARRGLRAPSPIRPRPDWRRCTRTSPSSARSRAREREHLDGLRERVGATDMVFVPYLARDVYDFEALHEVGQVLLG